MAAETPGQGKADKLTAADLRDILKEWQLCAEAEDAQRKRIVEAKKFRALDQWPTDIKLARQGAAAIAGLPATPPRPCLVVDRLNQPMRAVSNLIKNADFGFDVKPNGGKADQETADIIKGCLRRMQNQARGESPIEWAADGAIEGGIGWILLRADYVHQDWEGAPTEAVFDQELKLSRITNNLTVYCDPYAMDPTRRTARYMFVTEDLSRDRFKEQWPDANLRGLDEFEGTGNLQAWVTKDTVRIADYYRVTDATRSFYWLKDGSIHEGTPPKGADVRMTRDMLVPKVDIIKISATEELKRTSWPGTRIPLFPVLGEELNIDGKPWLRGIIEPGMDAQRMVNYTYSGGVEIFSLASRKPPMVPARSIAQYKTIWQTRTLYNHSYLPFDRFDEDGRELGEPIPDTSEAPIQAAVMLMKVSEDAIKSSTNTGDASLGNTNPNERSGKALQALQAQSDLANSNYPDNVRRALIAITEEAVKVLPKITRRGQILHIMGMDDEVSQVMVGQPFQKGPDGVPQPSPEDITPEIAKLPETLHTFYDLNNGTYSVTVTVGKATATRQEEGAAALGELIPHLPPEMAAVATPDYVEQLSFPGAHQIAEKLKKALPPQLQDQPKGQPQVPPQIQGIIQQLQQQVQQLQPMANDNMAKLQLEQMKQQAEDKRAQADQQFQLQLQREKMAGEIEKARITAAKESANIAQEGREERLSTGLELQAQAQQDQQQRAHELGMAAHQATVGQQQAHQQQAAARESQQAQQGHDAAMASQAQQAAAQAVQQNGE